MTFSDDAETIRMQRTLKVLSRSSTGRISFRDLSSDVQDEFPTLEGVEGTKKERRMDGRNGLSISKRVFCESVLGRSLDLYSSQIIYS